MQAQSLIRLHTGSPELQSSQWRHHFLQSGTGTPAEWDCVATIQSGTALSFLARTPEANAWLQSAATDLVRGVADKLGRVAPFEFQEIDVTARPDEQTAFWQYAIPKLVVAKNNKNWDQLKADILDADAQEQIRERIQKDLNAFLLVWGARSEDDSPIEIELVDAGRPMPVKAVSAERSGHGKPVYALSRLDVKFRTRWRIQGGAQVGMLQGLGYGRVFRAGREFEQGART